jgi:hypothetical protein
LGFALATVAMAGVLACYLWLDRWEPEPPRLLVMAFLWGASAAVLISVLLEQVIDQTFGSGPEKASFVTVAIGAPLIEEAAKGLFLLLMLTGRRRIELNTLTDCLVYAGFTAVGFAWLENIFYIASAETLPESLTIAGLRLGSALAHPDRLRRWAAWRDPWPVNGLAALAGEGLIGDLAWQRRVQRWLAREGPWLAGQLAGLEGLRPCPSAANFLLLQGSGSLEPLRQALETRHRILLRDCRSFEGLGENWLRLAVLDRAGNRRLLGALRRELRAGGGAR